MIFPARSPAIDSARDGPFPTSWFGEKPDRIDCLPFHPTFARLEGAKLNKRVGHHTRDKRVLAAGDEQRLVTWRGRHAFERFDRLAGALDQRRQARRQFVQALPNPGRSALQIGHDVALGKPSFDDLPDGHARHTRRARRVSRSRRSRHRINARVARLTNRARSTQLSLDGLKAIWRLGPNVYKNCLFAKKDSLISGNNSLFWCLGNFSVRHGSDEAILNEEADPAPKKVEIRCSFPCYQGIPPSETGFAGLRPPPTILAEFLGYRGYRKFVVASVGYGAPVESLGRRDCKLDNHCASLVASSLVARTIFPRTEFEL
jgi:hypothetical protein